MIYISSASNIDNFVVANSLFNNNVLVGFYWNQEYCCNNGINAIALKLIYQ